MTSRSLQAVVLVCCVLGTACSERTTGATEPVLEPVARVVLEPALESLQLGDSVQLTATPLSAAGQALSGRTVQWSSSNPAVLEVNEAGRALARGAGAATITATVGASAATMTIQVHPWNIGPNSYVVDPAVLRLMGDSAERAAGTFRFQALQGAPPQLVPGTVIVGTEQGGFLRRVTSATVMGPGLVLQTEPAALSDIIRVGGFSTSISLVDQAAAPAAWRAASAAAGFPGQVVWGEVEYEYVAAGLVARQGGFDISGLNVCDILEVGSAVGGESCPTGLKELKFTEGRLEFSPDFEMSATFDGFELQQFRGVLKGDLDLDVALRMEAAAEAKLEAKPKFFTLTRPFAFAIGPVPVVGYVSLTVEGALTAELSVESGVEMGVEATSSVMLGAEWAGGWIALSESNGSFTPRLPDVEKGTLKATAKAEIKVSLEPKAQIIFYGVIGPYAKVAPFGAAAITRGTECGMNATTGITAGVGFAIPFLDPKVGEFGRTWDPLVAGPEADWPCPLGEIQVSTITSGADLDEDGYLLLLDGDEAGALPVSGSTVIAMLEEGEYSLGLGGVAPNCTVVRGSTTAHVQVRQAATAEFEIVCSALTGDLEIRTATTGPEQDSNGYVVMLDGGSPHRVPVSGQLLLEGVPQGQRTVSLQDVAPNCRVVGDNPMVVTVQGGSRAVVTFDVECAETGIEVRVLRDGTPAHDGPWVVTLNGADPRHVLAPGTVRYKVGGGTYEVRLGSLPHNCTVQGGVSASVTVSPGSAELVEFRVTCATGGLTVTVSTDGDPSPAEAYSIIAGNRVAAIAVNGSASLDDLPAGPITVRLDGVPSHCTVQGLNPRTTTVPGGSVSFEVVCQAPAACTSAPEASLLKNIGANPGQGGTWSADYVASSYTLMSAFATSTAPGGSDGYLGPGVTVSMEGRDFLQFVPIDPTRLDEMVILTLNVAGTIEVGGSGPDVAVHTHLWVHGNNTFHKERRYNTDPNFATGSPGTFTASQAVEITTRLGDWTELRTALYINVGMSKDGSVSSSSAELRINGLVGVRDLNGLTVPIATVCAASGTVY